MNPDNSFPYVLLCSMVGATFGLAAVWLSTAYIYAPAVIGA